MKLKANVEVLSVRPYVYNNRIKNTEQKMAEIVFKTKDNDLFRVSKRVYDDSTPITQGEWEITINVIPTRDLKPEVSVIEF